MSETGNSTRTGSVMAPPNGVLALWNDCVSGNESFYEHWYQTEHLVERLGLAGIYRGRRYEAVDADPKFFTYYETETPAVLSSPSYVARLNDPTPATRRVMDGVFVNMSRTICECVARAGDMRGSVALTMKLTGGADQLLGLPASLANDSDTVARVELWEAVPEASAEPSAEEKLRGGDKKITACLFVELLRVAEARKLRDQLLKDLGADVESHGIYQFMCERISPGFGG